MFEEIVKIIRIVLCKPDLELAPETRADEIPIWDSIRNVEIVTSVESKYGFYFTPAEYDLMSEINLGEFVTMVEARVDALRKQ